MVVLTYSNSLFKLPFIFLNIGKFSVKVSDDCQTRDELAWLKRKYMSHRQYLYNRYGDASEIY